VSDTAKKIRASLASVTTSEIPGFAFAGCHSYTVTAVHAGGRCDLAPVRPKKMQPLKGVDQWPCIGGAVTTPTVGSIAVVEFRDWDRSQPMIVRFQPKRIDGGTPAKVTLDATEIDAGGTSALAKASSIVTWAGLVNGALNGLGAPIAALADPSTSTLKGG
jgi:hypothetical protein